MTPGRLAAFLALCAALGALFATAVYVGFTVRPESPDCIAVDYHDDAWWNADGEVVARAIEEDSSLQYVGPCA